MYSNLYSHSAKLERYKNTLPYTLCSLSMHAAFGVSMCDPVIILSKFSKVVRIFFFTLMICNHNGGGISPKEDWCSLISFASFPINSRIYVKSTCMQH